jgi:hypothetical protein
MRRVATWLSVAFVGALGLAATITALVADDDGKSAVPARGSRVTTVPVPRCRDGQLALATEMLGGSPFVVLRHVSGPTCDLGRLTVVTTIRDQRGERAPIGDSRDVFTGEISAGVEFTAGLLYKAYCDQKGPLVASITAGDLAVTRTLAIHGCFNRGDIRGD